MDDFEYEMFLERSVFLKYDFLLDDEREYWIHPINDARETLGEFHHLFPDLIQDNERFKSYLRMDISTFQTILQFVEEDLEFFPNVSHEFFEKRLQ